MSSMPVGFLGGKQSIIRMVDTVLGEGAPLVDNFNIKAQILGPWRVHRSTEAIGGDAYRLVPAAPVVVQNLVTNGFDATAKVSYHEGPADTVGGWPGLCAHYLISTSVAIMWEFYKDTLTTPHVEGFVFDVNSGTDIANGLYGDYPALIPGTFTPAFPDGETPGSTMGFHFGGAGIVPLDGTLMDLVAGDMTVWLGQF